MKPCLPLIGRLDDDEIVLWKGCLSAAMPDERICMLDELSPVEREAVEVAVIANPDPAELRQLPALKWVQSVWAGVDQLVRELGDMGLTVVRLVDPMLSRTMAEAVLAWTMYLHRDMPVYARQQAERRWRALPYTRPETRTVSLLGLGELGRTAAEVLRRERFRVCGWSRSRKTLEGVETFAGEEGLAEMLAGTDILVCLLPLTVQTRRLVNAKTLQALPAAASLINFARGPIVDERALLATLDAGRLKHAVLDVFDEEPLPAASPLWTHPAVTVLPHVSGPTDPDSAARIVADNIRDYREHGCIPAGVDFTRGY